MQNSYLEIKELILSHLNKNEKRPKKILKLKNKIFEILNKHKGNLFYIKNEKDESIPYIRIIPTNDVVPLNEENIQIQILFSKFGLDLKQNKLAKEILNHIKNNILMTLNNLKEIYKFTTIKNNKLYVSCGPRHLIYLNSDDMFEKVDNGFNDIYFESEYCLPEWNFNLGGNNTFYPNESHFHYLNSIKAFNINHYSPDGSVLYTNEMQSYVLKMWLIGVLLKIKPFPILLFYGNMSSGKTLTSKAIMRLFLGNNSDVSITPDNKRSLMASITDNYIYSIDNFDSKPPSWFSDTLTLAATGGSLSERKLFSDSKIFKKKIITYTIITSRTGNFAKREDIKDRVLPIFFNDRTDFKISEKTLLNDIDINRDKILSVLLFESQKFLNHLDDFSNNFYKYRFTEFCELLNSNIVNMNNLFDINQLIKAIVNSQFKSLTDRDPLIQTILEFDFEKNNMTEISGTPSEIVQILEKFSGYKNSYKPRIISRKLKENRDIFIINNFNYDCTKFGHSSKFTISRKIEL